MPRRIGLIVYGSLESVSGGYLYDRCLVETLRARGWRVRIFALPWRSYTRHLFDNLRGQLVQDIEEACLDLLLEDELSHPSLFALNRRLKSGFSGPIVSIVHHLRSSEHHYPAWQRTAYGVVERAYVRSVDAFIFNSRATAQSVRRLGGEHSPSIIAWPAGNRFQPQIDVRAIHARAQAAPPLRIVFLGNVISRKGLDTLINAVALLPRNTWSLTAVGDLEADRGLTRRLRQRVHTLRLLDHVWFAGRLSDADVAAILSMSHVLAIPSTYEGFGIAYLEGMSFGLPAIGTALGGAAEIITDGVNGKLIPPSDPGALSGALNDLVQDHRELVRMSEAALDRASSHPTWSESMTSAAQFLENLV